MKSLFILLGLFCATAVMAANPYDNPDTIFVARDGTGEFRTVNEAVEVCRAFMEYRKVIFVKKGTYKEKVIIPSWLDNITYNDTDLGLNLVGTAGWWWYNWKNSADVDYQSSGVAADMIQNGDFVDWMQTGVADTMIMASDPNAPVDPLPEDAEIAASDIIYWVGEGNNKVVFAINWADTALAWGYQFSTDSVYVSEIIDALVAADPRLSIEGTSSFISDFRYADENITDTLTITPHAADDYSIYFNMQVNTSPRWSAPPATPWSTATS